MNGRSFKSNRKGILLMLVSSLLACSGQLFWKLAVEGSLWELLLGFALYGLGAIVMIVAYKFGSLSVLQPVLSINYILSVCIGHWVLGEQLCRLNTLGVFAVMLGVILIAGGD